MRPQIIGLHFSGGNVYSLQPFFEKLKNDFDIELLELPGRGKRILEPLLYNRDAAVEDLLRQIRKRRKDTPYILYGHSMGAELGFIITKELEISGDPPLYFIPTGNAGPNVHKREKWARLPRQAFFDKLKEMGGFSEEILMNEELMGFFEPILRADFGLLEDAEDIFIDFTIDTPIYAIMGSEEKYRPEIENWKRYTHGGFSHQVMEGNHFFIFQHADAIMGIIRDRFSHHLSTSANV